MAKRCCVVQGFSESELPFYLHNALFYKEHLNMDKSAMFHKENENRNVLIILLCNDLVVDLWPWPWYGVRDPMALQSGFLVVGQWACNISVSGSDKQRQIWKCNAVKCRPIILCVSNNNQEDREPLKCNESPFMTYGLITSRHEKYGIINWII